MSDYSTRFFLMSNILSPRKNSSWLARNSRKIMLRCSNDGVGGCGGATQDLHNASLHLESKSDLTYRTRELSTRAQVCVSALILAQVIWPGDFVARVADFAGSGEQLIDGALARLKQKSLARRKAKLSGQLCLT